jgi:hypothetical protein
MEKKMSEQDALYRIAETLDRLTDAYIKNTKDLQDMTEQVITQLLPLLIPKQGVVVIRGGDEENGVN